MHVSSFDEIQWSVWYSFVAQALCVSPRSHCQIQGHVICLCFLLRDLWFCLLHLGY